MPNGKAQALSISRSLGMDDFINESWSIYGRNIRNNSWVGVKEGCQITSHMSVISSRLYILVLWLTGLDEKGDQIFKLRGGGCDFVGGAYPGLFVMIAVVTKDLRCIVYLIKQEKMSVSFGWCITLLVGGFIQLLSLFYSVLYLNEPNAKNIKWIMLQMWFVNVDI